MVTCMVHPLVCAGAPPHTVHVHGCTLLRSYSPYDSTIVAKIGHRTQDLGSCVADFRITMIVKIRTKRLEWWKIRTWPGCARAPPPPPPPRSSAPDATVYRLSKVQSTIKAMCTLDTEGHNFRLLRCAWRSVSMTCRGHPNWVIFGNSWSQARQTKTVWRCWKLKHYTKLI